MRDAAIPEIRTARLLLRGWRDSDLEAFATMNADPAVATFLTKALTREESDAFVTWIVDAWATRGFDQWALERLDTGALVGSPG